MKKSLIFFSCLAFGTVHAADWTPVFKPLENGCHETSQLLEDVYADHSEWKEKSNGDSYKTLLPNAKKGKYPKAPLPYRKDMLAAEIHTDKETGYQHVYIPLKNATLYGYNITGFSSYSRGATGVRGFLVYFKNKDTHTYNKLKRIKFIDIHQDDYSGRIFKDKKGNIVLECDASM